MLTSRRRVAALIVGLGTIAALIAMRPDLILTANTPTGGDMGAHVYLPAFLRDTLLPQGRIMGWSQDWYAGFPALYFYFPLPALAIVVLDVVLPYGVAFKAVTASGIIALPAAGYVFSRSMGFAPITSALGGVAGGMYVFMESHQIWGGNIKATMAGEYSFSIALALGLLYLGAVIRAGREGKGFTPMAGVLLALTALSHVIVVIVVVVASLPLLIRRRGVATVVGSWVLGFAIAAMWALPLLLRLSHTTDMGWDPVKGIGNLWPREFWPVLAVGVLGFAWALVRDRDVVPAAWLAIVPAAGYLAIPVLGYTKLYNARLLPFYYYTLYLFAGLAVGMAVSMWARRVRHYRPGLLAAWWAAALAAIIVITYTTEWLPSTTDAGFGGWNRPVYLLVVALLLGILVLRGTNFGTTREAALAGSSSLAAVAVLMVGIMPTADAPGWVKHNYTGYEGKPAFAEYEALMATIDGLPPGRVQWEANSDLGKYGTPMALMLIPYWTEGDQESMEGVYFESSLSTPTHFLNTAEVSRSPSNPVRGLDYRNFDFDRASVHLPFSGIDYYVSFTEEATAEATSRDDFEVVATSGPFTVFTPPPSELVEVASFEPVVYDGDRPFFDRLGVAVEWYGRVDELDRWLVADGPPEWPRTDDLPPRTVDGEPSLPSLVGVGRPIEVPGAVSNIEVTESTVSFTTTAVGVPHLVKVSDFPNWRVVNADGPYPAAPSFMMVVPTAPEVELRFTRTWDEWLGIALSVIGIVIAFAWSRLPRRQPAAGGRFAA